MDDVILSVEGIHVSYGPMQVLHGVSLYVRQGEIVALLGGNASGKSTTLKAILGLVRPSAGRILFRGARIDGRSPPEIIMRGIASVPEGRRLFPEMTVWENLLMGAYPRRGETTSAITRDADEILSALPTLLERRGALAGTLSGGEQQLLAMARARLRQPGFVCIDEPSMGLSPLHVEHVYGEIREWKRRGVSIIMVEQSANQALRVADRAYVLRTGEIVLEGAAAALANDPAVQRAYLGMRDERG